MVERIENGGGDVKDKAYIFLADLCAQRTKFEFMIGIAGSQEELDNLRAADKAMANVIKYALRANDARQSKTTSK